MIVLGLTGSLAMGKSTTAAMFRRRGVPVHDADAAVHALYRGEAVAPVAAAFASAVVGGAVDRARLGALVLGDAAAMARLEAIVHPLVATARQRFLAAAAAVGHRVAVIDVPLLFETGAEAEADAVVVVTAAPAVQRARALARPGATAERVAAILARQMPDAEKRRRAHFLIETDHGHPAAERGVAGILRAAALMAGRGTGRWHPRAADDMIPTPGRSGRPVSDEADGRA